MVTLQHCFDARSFRPLWTLEELGLPYTLAMLPFPPRVLARDYLSLNPLGTIPLLIDGATRTTESAAICQYLATRYGPSQPAVSPEEGEYGTFLNHLHFGEATLTFPQTIVLRYARLEPEGRLPQAAKDYRRWFLARLRAVDAIVSHQDTLCGRFTVADISVGYALLLAGNIGRSGTSRPRSPPTGSGYRPGTDSSVPRRRSALRRRRRADRGRKFGSSPA